MNAARLRERLVSYANTVLRPGDETEIVMAGPSHSHGHEHHGHHHGHGHAHGHAPTGTHDRAFAIGIALNLAFIGGEVVFGLVAQSVSLLADAGHNLSDVLGLGAAWAAIALGRRTPSKRFTYGLKGSTILAALLNALLLVALGAILLEAARRLAVPAPVDGPVVAWDDASTAAVGC